MSGESWGGKRGWGLCGAGWGEVWGTAASIPCGMQELHVRSAALCFHYRSQGDSCPPPAPCRPIGVLGAVQRPPPAPRIPYGLQGPVDPLSNSVSPLWGGGEMHHPPPAPHITYRIQREICPPPAPQQPTGVPAVGPPRQPAPYNLMEWGEMQPLPAPPTLHRTHRAVRPFSTLKNSTVEGTAPPRPFPHLSTELRELQPLPTLPVPYNPYGVQGVAAPHPAPHKLMGFGACRPLLQCHASLVGRRDGDALRHRVGVPGAAHLHQAHKPSQGVGIYLSSRTLWGGRCRPPPPHVRLRELRTHLQHHTTSWGGRSCTPSPPPPPNPIQLYGVQQPAVHPIQRLITRWAAVGGTARPHHHPSHIGLTGFPPPP